MSVHLMLGYVVRMLVILIIISNLNWKMEKALKEDNNHQVLGK